MTGLDRQAGHTRIAWLIDRLPWLALLLAVGLALLDPPTLESARLKYFDQLQRWQPRAVVGPPVIVVDIDEQSIQRLGQWPWPRSVLSDLLETLTKAGARVIGFDMAFPEADRTSPLRAGEARSTSQPTSADPDAPPDNDARLARTLASSRVVLGFALQRLPRSTLRMPVSIAVRGGDDVLRGIPEFGGRLGSLDTLEAAAAGLGHFSVLDTDDGIVRSIPLLVRVGDQIAPSLVLEMARVGAARPTLLVEGSAVGGVSHVQIDHLTLPTTGSGAYWLHYAPMHRSAYIPAWQVLERESTFDVKGRYVLVGSSASLMHDERKSPLGELIPGVEVHRQALQQMLDGQAVERPSWATPAEFLALVTGCLIAIRLGGRPLNAASGILLFGLPALAFSLSAMAFARAGLFLDPLAAVSAWALCVLAAALARLYRTERRQRWIRSAFSRYVSPNLVRHLIEHPGALELGGVRRRCSFIFTDLEGYTGLVERTPPREAVALLNGYLDGMIEIAFRHDGTLLRIVGDAVAIMFSAPLEQADHAQRAFDCAIAMDRFAEAYRLSQPAAGHRFGRTRIGVHSGEVTVGNFGGSTMLEYAALGNPINEAARLESANKRLGTRICISGVTLAECHSSLVRPVGRVFLRGRSDALDLFEPVTALDEPYHAAFHKLEDDQTAARRAFEDLHALRPGDALVAFHLARLRAGAAGIEFRLD